MSGIRFQIANVGPLGYSLLRWRFPGLPQHLAVYVLLSVGTLASLLLVPLWDATSPDGRHSVGLLALLFFLSLVDCTSSVLFLPFMSTFRAAYLNSYLIGEGLSGLVPAVVALAQGVGGNPYCQNTTAVSGDGSILGYQVTTVYPEPRYKYPKCESFMANWVLLFAFISGFRQRRSFSS